MRHLRTEAVPPESQVGRKKRSLAWEWLLPGLVWIISMLGMSSFGISPLKVWNSLQPMTRVIGLAGSSMAAILCVLGWADREKGRLVVVTLALVSLVSPLIGIEDMRASIQASGSTGADVVGGGLADTLASTPYALVGALVLTLVTCTRGRRTASRWTMVAAAFVVLCVVAIDAAAWRGFDGGLPAGGAVQGPARWIVRVVQPGNAYR